LQINAGTTPHEQTQNFARRSIKGRVVWAVREEVRAETGRQVGTVGWDEDRTRREQRDSGKWDFSGGTEGVDADKVNRKWRTSILKRV